MQSSIHKGVENDSKKGEIKEALFAALESTSEVSF